MKTLKEIKAAEELLEKVIWLSRQLYLIEEGKLETKERMIAAKNAARKVEKALSKKALSFVSCSDEDWAILLGKINAIRWLFSEGEDILNFHNSDT